MFVWLGLFIFSFVVVVLLLLGCFGFFFFFWGGGGGLRLLLLLFCWVFYRRKFGCKDSIMNRILQPNGILSNFGEIWFPLLLVHY